MEIKVIPSRLKKHTLFLDEEIRISRQIRDMAESTFVLSPQENEIVQSICKLNRSIERRREIIEDLDESIQNQENWLREYIDCLKGFQRR